VNSNTSDLPSNDDVSPDRQDRVNDFLARHGGPGPAPLREGELAAGLSGWSEVSAADGYTLRCEWSRMGSKEEMKFSEIPPPSANHMKHRPSA
jgi:hypothetical protein